VQPFVLRDQHGLVRERGGGDQAVGGIGVQRFERDGCERDARRDGQEAQAVQRLAARDELVERQREHEAPLLHEHGRLPHADGGHAELAVVEGARECRSRGSN
jgi:hypothetical protein